MEDRRGQLPRTSPGSRRRGRPPVVDEAAIVDAALTVGFAQLSMSAVGRQLGLAHSTLYRYFPDREALAAAAIDRAVAAHQWPAPENDWRNYLRELASSFWGLYAAHPGLAAEVAGLRSTSAALVDLTNRSAGTLLESGFEADTAVLVVDMLGDLVTHAFVPPTAGPPSPDQESESLEESTQRRVALMSPWLDRFEPQLRGAFAATIRRTPQEQLTRKIEVMIAGLAQGRRPG